MWAPRFWAVRFWAPRYWPPSAAPVTPTGPITRLAQFGVGTQRYVDFSGKTPEGRGVITRLGQMAIGTQRYDTFAGKTPSIGEPTIGQRIRGFTRNVGRLMNP